MNRQKPCDYPVRKRNRLKGFDYSSNGAYFITFCTKDKKNVFWKRRGAHCAPENSNLHLTREGIAADEAIVKIPQMYPMISVENYVVMPNHIHLLLMIHNDGSAMRSPTISTVINQLKGVITKKLGFSVWQTSFHDHIIRDIDDYEMIWEYIDANPFRWKEDCFYNE